jgi:hypothetical protein
MRNTTTALILTFFVAGAAFAAKPRIQWDTNYDNSSVSTFQWVMPPEYSLADSDPFLHQHIINAIQYQLTSRGLTEVESNADINVTYHLSVDTDVSLRSSSVGYSFGRYGMGGWGYYGYGMGGPVYTNTDVVEVERGELVVDIWDTASDQLVWRGSVSDITISGNSDKTTKNVEKAIEKMAKQYDKLRKKMDR